MPLFAGGRNEFVEAHSKVLRSARTANEVLVQLAKTEAALTKPSDKEDLKGVQAAKASVQAALEAFGAFDKTLNTAPAGGTKSPFDKLVETAAVFNDPAAGFLIVQLPEIGASGGTRSRFIGSDKLEFQSTALANYVALNKDGVIVDAAVEALGRASSMTAEEAQTALLSLSSSIACE